MLLGLTDRLALYSALPREGSFEDLKVLRELRERLTLTEEERLESGFRQDGEFSRWDKDVQVDFTFTKGERALLVKGLEAVSAKGIAQESHLVMYNRLSVEGEQPHG